MNGTLHYFILKNYEGKLIKKNKSNTHLMMIPVDPKKYMYVAIIGEMVDNEEDTYAAQLIVKFPEEILEETIIGEEEYFGNRFIEIETLNCNSSAQAPGNYIITFPKKGVNILSNLEINYELEYSTSSRRIYLIKGTLNLVSEEIDDKNMKMVAAKQSAFIGKTSRFIEYKKLKRGNYLYE